MMVKPKLPPLAKYVAIGLAVALLIGGIGFMLNTSSQVRLDGKILKVRAIPADDAASLAVVDFRVTNPSGALFQLKKLTVVVTTANGHQVEGLPVAQTDLDRVLDYHKVYGKRYTDMLKERDRIRPKTEVDRTAAGSLSISEKDLLNRRSLVLRLQDADGVTIEIPETSH